MVQIELRRDPDSLALDALSRALSNTGPIAIGELPRLQDILLQYPNYTSTGQIFATCFDIAQQEIREATQRLYDSYIRSGARSHIEYPLLGRDQIPLKTHGLSIGAYAVVFDGRVDYVAEGIDGRVDAFREAEETLVRVPPHQRREVRCVVLQDDSNGFLCLAVSDPFSSSRMFVTFPSFMAGVVASFQPQRIQFGIVDQLQSGALPTRFVKAHAYMDAETGELVVTDWRHDQDLTETLGASGYKGWASMRALFGEAAQVSDEFLHFLGGLNQEEHMRARFIADFHASGRNVLDYDDLKTDFCEQVATAWRFAKPGKGTSTYSDVECADSLSPRDLWTPVLPEPILDIFLRCHDVAAEWRARENKAPQVKEAFLEWPSLAEIPAQYRLTSRRSFEIEIPDPEKTGAAVLNLDPHQFGVVLFRCRDGETFYEVSNVPTSVWTPQSHSSWFGFGSWQFALNVLNTFVPPGSDNQEPIEYQHAPNGLPFPTFASRTAHDLASDFERDVVLNIPVWGGVVSPERIRAWILDKLDDRA